MSSRGSIHFLLGQQAVEVSDFDPQTSVLDWLRINERRMGTREGCAEGDCGACSVVIGELHGDSIRYRAFNACILLLATLDGKQLLTVEDLAADELHPVQQAIVKHHGSQCGFCTPGFVMSLFALLHDERRNEASANRLMVDESLAGNLCRCTGYLPIARAAMEVLQKPVDDDFSTNRTETVHALRAISRTGSLDLGYQGRRFYAPANKEELAAALRENPNAVILAGGTDVGLWITKQLQMLKTIISVAHVPELQQLAVNRESVCLEIGAAVTYSDAFELLCEHFPDFRPMLSRLGAVQVRNAGTIGGNIANGSPIGDMPPPLIALRAQIVLRSTDGARALELEDYFIGYGKQDRKPGEYIEKVLIPLPADSQHFRVYKLSRRFDQDISAVCAAFVLQLEGDIVQSIRICYGGMAGIPARAAKTEQTLLGERWCSENVERAMAAMVQDYQPLTDWRASSDYRMVVAQNLLSRFYLETTTDEPVQLLRTAHEK